MKYLFLIFAFSYTITAGAQQRFIEVTVTDTVMTKSDYFIYRLQLLPEVYATDSDWTSDTIGVSTNDNSASGKRNGLNRSFDSLINTLRHDGFAVMPRTLSDSFAVPARFSEFRNARIFTRSIDTLGMIFRKVKDVRFLMTGLETAKAADEKPGYARLYKKLVDVAASRAAFIAAQGKHKLGRLLSIREASPVQTAEDGWTAYPPLSALGSDIPGWHTNLLNSNSNDHFGLYALEKTFVVRYALE